MEENKNTIMVSACLETIGQAKELLCDIEALNGKYEVNFEICSKEQFSIMKI
nr:MAG TPA: hypothetical protein [Caudoviricetes sp.]